MVGTPFIANAGVRAEVLEHRKGDKVLIFKKKRRKQYRRFKGHRQQLVRVRVTDILPDVSQAPEKKPAPPAEKPEPRPTPAAKPVPAREAKAAPAKKPAKQAKPEKTKAAPKKATVKPVPKARKQK